MLRKNLRSSIFSHAGAVFIRLSKFEYTCDKVDGNFDILMVNNSHVPPKGHMDGNCFLNRIGCPHLLAAIRRAKPKVAIFRRVVAERRRGFRDQKASDL